MGKRNRSEKGPVQPPKPPAKKLPALPILIGLVVVLAGAVWLGSGAGDRAPAGGGSEVAAAAATTPAVETAQAPPPPAEPGAPAPATAARPAPVPAAGELPPLPFVPGARPPEVVRSVYEFAARRPDVLQYVPCFCGCERSGHGANDDCFVATRGAKGTVTWDPHGAT